MIDLPPALPERPRTNESPCGKAGELQESEPVVSLEIEHAALDQEVQASLHREELHPDLISPGQGDKATDRHRGFALRCAQPPAGSTAEHPQRLAADRFAGVLAQIDDRWPGEQSQAIKDEDVVAENPIASLQQQREGRALARAPVTEDHQGTSAMREGATVKDVAPEPVAGDRGRKPEERMKERLVGERLARGVASLERILADLDEISVG